jgi:alpha-glucosidase
MYYGQELGMTTETPTRKQDVRDPIGITGWPAEKGRDGERTPMQWTAAPLAGFTTNPTPWLPVPANHATINVASETADPNSLLRYYEQLIALRRTNPSLHDGTTTFLDTTNPNVLSYVRTSPGSKPVLITLNFTSQPQTIALDLTTAHIAVHGLKSLIASQDLSAFACKNCSEPAMTTNLTLPPYASLIVQVQP